MTRVLFLERMHFYMYMHWLIEWKVLQQKRFHIFQSTGNWALANEFQQAGRGAYSDKKPPGFQLVGQVELPHPISYLVERAAPKRDGGESFGLDRLAGHQGAKPFPQAGFINEH